MRTMWMEELWGWLGEMSGIPANGIGEILLAWFSKKDHPLFQRALLHKCGPFYLNNSSPASGRGSGGGGPGPHNLLCFSKGESLALGAFYNCAKG